jgi:hypothetical protein
VVVPYPYLNVYPIVSVRQLPEYRDWYRRLSETKGVPADEFLLRVHHFAQRLRVDPKKLLELAPASLEEHRSEFARLEGEAGRPREESERTFHALREWLGFHRRSP